MFCSKWGIGLACVFFSGWGAAANAGSLNLASWIIQQESISRKQILANISPVDGRSGAVIASPSQQDPNYYFTWVRDAALTMNEVMDWIEQSGEAEYLQKMNDYVEFSKIIQKTPNRSGGLGEPKFNVNGTAFNDDWGRPQNDGPALRAMTLIRYARFLLKQGRNDWVKEWLYDAKLPAETVIKADLEYVSHHWQDDSYDLWEEVRGHHFYTQMVQRRALLEGALLADDLEDPNAAKWYREQAKGLEKTLSLFQDRANGMIQATLQWSGGLHEGLPEGLKDKFSGLDVAVILAALHTEAEDGFFGSDQEMILATAQKLRERFQHEYVMNQDQALAPVIGRYPEDQYNGVGIGKGNPWVLATLAYAELYYRVARIDSGLAQIEVTGNSVSFYQTALAGVRVGVISRRSPLFKKLIQGLIAEGDRFLARIYDRVPCGGDLSEQMNRNTGKMQGAEKLTWSYASFMTAVHQRELAVNSSR